MSINRLEDALPLANALLEGRISIIEITLRTEHALKAIELIATSLPEISVGAGTIVTKEQVQQCRDHGANFGLSPGTSIPILKEASVHQWPFSPGVASASEMMQAMSMGYSTQKKIPLKLMEG